MDNVFRNRFHRACAHVLLFDFPFVQLPTTRCLLAVNKFTIYKGRFWTACVVPHSHLKLDES